MNTQEFTLQAPGLTSDRFFVEKRGNRFQRWEQQLFEGNEVEFFYEDEGIWLKGTVHRWYVDDGSGNAPELKAHFFLAIRRNGHTYKYDLHEDLLIRLKAPTDEELIARKKFCEGGDYEYVGPYHPDRYIPCTREPQEFITPSGWLCWYCSRHKPMWLTSVA